MTRTRPERSSPAEPSGDGLVHVVRAERDDHDAIVHTEHFQLHRRGRHVEVSHRLLPEQLDNDLTRLLVDELFTPGWLSGNDIFERVFTGVVHSTVADPEVAWSTFYRNTLTRIRAAWQHRAPADPAHSVIDAVAPVYARALRLVPPGRVLDLGSCFGFLALLLAERGRNTVVAADIVPGSMRLLASIAWRQDVALDTLVCDAAQVPLPDRSFDTVTLIHLLEHLDEPACAAVLSEALRLAASRVIVAVPFEDEPATVFGHVRCYDTEALRRLGQVPGWRTSVSEHHGGWLVLDRAAA